MVTFHAAIGPGFWAPEVIGDFQEDEARNFVEEELRQAQSSVTLDDNAWTKVYEVGRACIPEAYLAKQMLSDSFCFGVHSLDLAIVRLVHLGVQTCAQTSQVCGGNAGALLRLASRVNRKTIRGNWEKGGPSRSSCLMHTSANILLQPS